MIKIHDFLFTGNALEARNPKLLFDHEFVGVVDLAYEERPAVLPREFIYCRIPLHDGEGNQLDHLKFAIEVTIRMISAKSRTLLACSAGLNRSPTIAAAAMAIKNGQSFEHSIHQIAETTRLDLAAPLLKDVMSALGEFDSRSHD